MATRTRSGGSCSVGTPGTKPSARPPRTSSIGYGIRSVGATARSAATATSRASRTSWAWVPKSTPRAYAAATSLRQDRSLQDVREHDRENVQDRDREGDRRERCGRVNEHLLPWIQTSPLPSKH